MSEETPAVRRQRWKARIAVSVVGLGIGLLLASSRIESAESILHPAVVWIKEFLGELVYSMPVVMVGALLYVQQRKAAVLWAALICAGVYSMTGLFGAIMNADPFRSRGLVAALHIFQSATSPYYVIPMLLLAVHRFRGKLDRVRIA